MDVTEQLRTAETVLASFYAPARAGAVAASLAPSDEPVAAAVRLVRGELAASDTALAVALDAAGLPPAAIARLLQVSVLDVNRWLDDELVLVPTDPDDVRPPVRLRVARAVVRTTWIVLGLLAVVAVVSSRGGVVPCPVELCIDGVDVLLSDGSAVPATSRSVFDPTEVVGVRLEHRAQTSRAVTVVWSVDGDQLATVLVTLTGSGRTTVEVPAARLPIGVHVVELLDRIPGGAATFVVE